MRAYKVVKKRGGRFRSCVVEGNSVAVVYARGKAVSAPKWLAEKGYHLCVFKRIREARIFADSHDKSSKVWLANVRGVIWNLPLILNTDTLSHKKISAGGGGWPSGTLMAKSVTIIKQIKERRHKKWWTK